MKIVFLSDDFPPTSFGGAGISTYELAKGMKEAGHDVYVITTCRSKNNEGEIDYNGLEVFKIKSNYSQRWRAYISINNRPVVKEVKRILEDLKPDIVHANNIHYHLSYKSLKISEKYAKVVLLTARDTMLVSYGKIETKRYLENLDPHITWFDNLKYAKKRYNPLRNFFIKRYLRYADKIFAISKSLQESLLKNGIRNVGVIYNGLDCDDWVVNETDVVEFRNTHNLDSKKIILFSGRLSAQKGGEKALKALVQIIKQVPTTVLLVAGTIDEYARIMIDYAKKMGIENSVIFTGWIERDGIKTMYGSVDVVWMPSIYLDAFGRVNIEAMASKKPVIGTCYGGTPEVTLDGVTGYIVNPLNPEEIAEKTIDLLKNPQKAEKFGKAGYERLKSNFNLKDKVREYIAVYEKLISQKNDNLN